MRLTAPSKAKSAKTSVNFRLDETLYRRFILQLSIDGVPLSEAMRQLMTQYLDSIGENTRTKEPIQTPDK